MSRTRDLGKVVSGNVNLPSAAVDSDFTVDTSTLVVDATNNRVGVGTSSPSENLQVHSSGESFIKVSTDTTGTSAFVGVRMQDGDGDLGSIGDFGSGRRAFMVDTGSGVNMMFFTNNQNNSTDNPRMTIDTSGHVTMPYQPSFMAIGQATTLPTSTDTLLRFNTTTFNTGGHYNTSTYRFTAPVTGVYYFHVQVRLTGVSNNGRYDIIFRKNGTGAMGGGQNQQGSNDPGINVSAFLSLAANDYVDVYMNQNNGSSLNTDTSLNTSQGGTSAATHFFGYLVK